MAFRTAHLKNVLRLLGSSLLTLFTALDACAGPGAVDPTFNVIANNPVYSILTEPNGEILVGGAFTTIAGVTRSGLARLYPDGTLDPTFTNSLVLGGTVYALLLQPDGKLLVGGLFSAGSPTRQNVVRLNPDGSVDGTFTNSGASSTVYALGLQTNGQVLIGGQFTTAGVYPNSSNHYYVARLNSDGTVDNSFNPGIISGQQVNAIAVQADGNILIGGLFGSFSTYGLTREDIARITTNGTPDLTYAPLAASTVQAIYVEPEGESMWGGNFTAINQTTRTRVARLTATGGVDGGFAAPGGPSGTVYAVTEDASGNIYIGGQFSSYNNSNRQGVARVFSDGTLDATFNVSTNYPIPLVRCLAIQGDGKVLVGGSFTTFNSTPCTNLVRLYGNNYPAQIVTQPQSAYVSAGGSVTFSVDVGNPGTVSYQWYYNGAEIPGATDSEYSVFNVQSSDAGNYSVFVSTEEGGVTSSNAVLAIAVAPAILQQPTNETVAQGGTATFTAAAAGAPLNYYWIRTNNSGGPAGPPAGTNATLSLTNVQPGQAATYYFVASNFLGSVTSAPVTLSVIYPVTLLGSPGSYAVPVGSEFIFSVSATGNPLNYKWFFNGNPLAGATAASYRILNVALTNAGGYYATVTNQFNSVTSSVATLAVGIPPQTIQINVLSNQLPQIQATGTPGFPYVLQTTTNFQSPVVWQNIVTNFADTNGNWSYVDTNGFSANALYYQLAIP